MSAKNILEPLGIEVDNVKMETTEIQADTVEEDDQCWKFFAGRSTEAFAEQRTSCRY